MSRVKRLSEGADRLRGTRPPVVLGWLFVLLALFSCCSLTSAHPASAGHGRAASAAVRAAPAAPAPAVQLVMIDAPGDHGLGSSCHGTAEHSAPVVLPAPPGPAALPSTSAAAPAYAPLTGGTGIRGPSNEAVGDVDRLRLQVQRI
ncbi:hypothetical protein [Streptomyces sp. ITFR-16]|uniref:hypothetical protein n=1 Tax=Streptomyces sp. ITFR-16 TaxID=3075198 RepID=UPI0028891712|nr:hypothetical protein [Streptomyces sp. ITFR-16]WNI21203.1 hypothetical protein RLT58_04335 [Streptomyces sp. ITFR-16]